MSLQINHKGIQISVAIDPDWLQSSNPGYVDGDLPTPELQTLVGGRAVMISEDGFVALADGDLGRIGYLGALIKDAFGGFYENMPGFGSGNAAVAIGPCVLVTDQIVAGLTFAPRDLLYPGTGTEVGLYTNFAPDPDAVACGIAISAASDASPSLTFVQF